MCHIVKANLGNCTQVEDAQDYCTKTILETACRRTSTPSTHELIYIISKC